MADSLKDRLKAGAAAAGKQLSDSGRDMMDQARSDADARSGPVSYGSYKRGGKVRKTGLARVHRGERVIPRKKVKRVEKAMRKSGIRYRS